MLQTPQPDYIFICAVGRYIHVPSLYLPHLGTYIHQPGLCSQTLVELIINNPHTLTSPPFVLYSLHNYSLGWATCLPILYLLNSTHGEYSTLHTIIPHASHTLHIWSMSRVYTYLDTLVTYLRYISTSSIHTHTARSNFCFRIAVAQRVWCG